MLFTIIIPTYNRAVQLYKNLECLLPQVRRYKGLVDVYVSDNASTDDTNSVVEHYLNEYADVLTYFRQPENIGGNPNFFHAVEHVDSKYICLLGDDDYVRTNYLDVVMGLIEKYPDAGLINYNMLSVTDTNIICGVRDSHAYDGHIGHYKNGGDFFKKHLRAPSLMSSNVFLREPFVEASKKINKEDFPGYDWYMALALSVIDKPCVYYDFPLLCATVPSKVRWVVDAPWYHIYGFGHMFRELDKHSHGIESVWKEDYYRDRQRYDFMLQVISENRNVYKEKLSILLEYASNKSYAFKIKIYAQYPLSIANCILKVGMLIMKLLKTLHLR